MTAAAAAAAGTGAAAAAHPKTSIPQPRTRHALSPLIAGLSGGAVSTALLYPLDLIKVRLQVNEDQFRLSRRRTIMCTLRGVIRHEGALGLYQGLAPALVGSAVSWGGYFFLYEGIKRRMLERKEERQVRLRTSARRRRRDAMTNNGGGGDAARYDMSKDMHVDEEIDIDTNDSYARLGPLEHFSASCIAGAAMVCVTNPVWLIKTRMQLQIRRVQEAKKGSAAEVVKPYKGMFDAARTIVREEGPLALYKGAVPAMMLVSHGGVQFVSYEFLKNHFGTYTKATREMKEDHHRSSIVEQLQDSLGYLTMGAISKIIASTTTYPLQVIKARLQQRSHGVELTEAGEIMVTKRVYAGVTDCVSRILRNEGIAGFFKGCIPNAIRVAPSAAITFVVYESVMDAFN